MLNLSQEADLLRKVPMFAKLEPSKLKLLAFTSESFKFKNAEELFQTGDPADCAYVIMSGEVAIMVVTESGEESAFERDSNELVGEMGILTNSPRSTSVRARGEVTAMRINDEAFIRLLRENSEIALNVMRQLVDRLAQSTVRYEEVQNKFQRYELLHGPLGSDH
jgi:CRP/FNR family cyclic AMP-dependent transcriptional regulator